VRTEHVVEEQADDPFAGSFSPVTSRDISDILRGLGISKPSELDARFGEVQRKISSVVTKRLLAARESLKENTQ
jgi:hypothetical protein